MNDYSSLIAVASRIGPEESLSNLVWDERGDPQEFLHRNSDLLMAARQLLARDLRRSVRYEADFLSHSLEELTHYRNLARALTLQLRHSHAVGNLEEALVVGCDILRLANVSRGGLVAHMLVGDVIEYSALQGLNALRRRLSPDLCKTAIAALRQLEDEREPYEEVARRDQLWEETVDPKEPPIDMAASSAPRLDEADLSYEQQRLFDQFNNLPASDKRDLYMAVDRKTLAMLRLLRTDLSLRCWHAANGEYPSELNCADLIDPTAGLDPFTGKAFVYRRDTPHLFTLYSPGPTLIDNGGAFGAWTLVSTGKADLCLDIADYED
jgi:hypothetical protein